VVEELIITFNYRYQFTESKANPASFVVFGHSTVLNVPENLNIQEILCSAKLKF
jgi:hypothetical protein